MWFRHGAAHIMIAGKLAAYSLKSREPFEQGGKMDFIHSLWM
jgi:hypothetical protein